MIIRRDRRRNRDSRQAGGGDDDSRRFRLSSSKVDRRGCRPLERPRRGARPLSGGHSLIPMMKLRLAKPSDLVDLGPVQLKGIREEDRTFIGATTTQHDLIASSLIAGSRSLWRRAWSFAAHRCAISARSAATSRRRSRQRHAGGDRVLAQPLAPAGVASATSRRGDYRAAIYRARAAKSSAIRIPIPPSGTATLTRS